MDMFWYEIYVNNYVYALMFRAYKLHEWCIMTCLWGGGSHSWLAPWRGCKSVFIVHVNSGGTNRYIRGWIQRKMYIYIHIHHKYPYCKREREREMLNSVLWWRTVILQLSSWAVPKSQMFQKIICLYCQWWRRIGRIWPMPPRSAAECLPWLLGLKSDTQGSWIPVT